MWPAALTPATAHSFRCGDTMLWTRLSRFTNTTCNKFLLLLHIEKKLKRSICKEESFMSAVNQVWLAKGLSDLKWWSVAIDICQPSVPPFSETPLIQSVSLCLTVNQHRCEQPACRQLNNQTLHQTCSALPSGDRRKWQQGERAMDAKKKVVERERTKESALALLSLGEGGVGVSLPCHQISI